ncbi:hypothetical protein [Pedobacter agri]|uniref:hypothetical protein n=1 Tax=Pedobacter agri TaxID=454586 RepID=UPI00293121E5|nr:hypothetical protein [Pedobacter agri]
MKNLLYLPAIFVFFSCNSEQKDANQTVITTPAGLEGLQKTNTAAVAAAQTSTKTLIFNPKHGQPGHTCALAEGAPLNQNGVAQPQQNITQVQPAAASIPVNTDTGNEKLNPKHGEPGHRCDIAVGAPLSSKPVQAVQTSTTQPVVAQTVNTKVAKGMNPPHGQPNHRCDIAVGAPLNSKPVQAASSTPAQTINKAETKAPLIFPNEAKAPESQAGAKLNPKHGEPGHRCDIAVGAPLT